MIKGLFYAAWIAALLALAGVLGIWALNTLFGLGIPYTFPTIVATLLLSGAVGGGRVQS